MKCIKLPTHLLSLSRCKPLFDIYAFYDFLREIKTIQSRAAIFSVATFHPYADTQYQSFMKNVLLFRPLDGSEFFLVRSADATVSRIEKFF